MCILHSPLGRSYIKPVPKRTSVVGSNITHSTNIASALNAAQNKNADNIIAKYDVYPPDIRHLRPDFLY